MLKGHVFKEQKFGNQIFALFINTFLNGKNGIHNDYKNAMAVTYNGSNVTVDSGVLCIQGRFLEEDTSTTIDAGTEALYCKLVVEIDLSKINTASELNQAYYKIISDSNMYPTLTQNDIVKNNTGIYQYELARFRTTLSGITEFQDMRTYLDFESIYEEIRAAIEGIEDTSDLAFKNWVEGTVLYESETGLNQTTPIPLTDTVSNYKRIKIYYKNDDGSNQIWNTAELFDAVGKKCTLETMRQGSMNIYKHTAEITVAENQINWGYYGQFTINGNGISDYHVNYQGFIRIYKVVGYKY